MMMKFTLIAALLAFVVLVNGMTYNVAVGTTAGADSFIPANINVFPGDTVVWTWAGNGHNVVSGGGCNADGKFTSGTTLQNAGYVYNTTFSTAGSYPYFCSPHCSEGMKGVVTVATTSTTNAAGMIAVPVLFTVAAVLAVL